MTKDNRGDRHFERKPNPMQPYYDKFLNEPAMALYKQVLRDRNPARGEEPLYAIYAFYTEKVMAHLAENPEACTDETIGCYLEAALLIAAHLQLPGEPDLWAD